MLESQQLRNSPAPFPDNNRWRSEPWRGNNYRFIKADPYQVIKTGETAKGGHNWVNWVSHCKNSSVGLLCPFINRDIQKKCMLATGPESKIWVDDSRQSWFCRMQWIQVNSCPTGRFQWILIPSGVLGNFQLEGWNLNWEWWTWVSKIYSRFW